MRFVNDGDKTCHFGVILRIMNLRKRTATASFNRANAKYQKHLFETKVAASKRQNWDIKTVREMSDLIQSGGGILNHKWAILFEEEKPFNVSSLGLASLKKMVKAPALRVRSARAHQQRIDLWKNVFAFLPNAQVPTLAGAEYILGDGNSPDQEAKNPSVGVATFSYPSEINMPNVGDELFYANFETYNSVVETVKDRMGLSYVAIEPVGVITDEGQEINGTVGNLGFRVWYSQRDDASLFATPRPFSIVHQCRVEIIAKVRKMAGLERTFLESTLVRRPKKCSGEFHVITIASDTATPQDYMKRAEDIRTTLGVPGLMITPFGPLNDDRRLDSDASGEADKNGVYHTALIFYTGDESEVVMEDDTLNGDQNSVVSGFMPVRSAGYILSKWEPKSAEVQQPAKA
jgi:hypothetical protein